MVKIDAMFTKFLTFLSLMLNFPPPHHTRKKENATIFSESFAVTVVHNQNVNVPFTNSSSHTSAEVTMYLNATILLIPSATDLQLSFNLPNH